MSTTGEDLATVTLHMPALMKDQLEWLARLTGRQQSVLAVEAIGRYLEAEVGQIVEIQDAIRRANDGEFAQDERVAAVRDKFRTMSLG